MKPTFSGSFVMLGMLTIFGDYLTSSSVVAEPLEDLNANRNTSRVAVVTGGNKGIGFAIVKSLCERFDGIVYLTARNVGKGEAAVKKLEKFGNKLRFHQLDITDDSSVEQFKEYINFTHGGLDVLVNNAAIAFLANSTEPFAYRASETLRVNYFSLLKVSRALFPLLRPHSRVVHMSSILGHLSKIPGDSLKARFSSPNLTEDGLNEIMREFVDTTKTNTHRGLGWPDDFYAVSKVGVAALSRVQQREFDRDEREDLVVNAVHPGYVDTDMTLHQGHFTTERGAQAPVYLALLPANTNVKGQYVWSDNSLVDWVNGPLPGAF